MASWFWQSPNIPSAPRTFPFLAAHFLQETAPLPRQSSLALLAEPASRPQWGPEPCLTRQGSEGLRGDPKVTPRVRGLALQVDLPAWERVWVPTFPLRGGALQHTVGCLWLPAAGLAGASTAGSKGPKRLCLHGWTGPGEGYLPNRCSPATGRTWSKAGNHTSNFFHGEGRAAVLVPMASLVITQLLSCQLPSWHLCRTSYPGLLPSKASQEALCSPPTVVPLKETSRRMVALCTFRSLASPGPAFRSCLLPSGLALSAMWQVPSHSPGFLPLLGLEAD